MIQQMIYRRAEQGYRTVAASEGLAGKSLARRIEALSTLPPSGGKKRLGAQPVYSRCAVEDGLVVLMTVIDPGGIRGSHMTHAWYVQPEDAAAFAAGSAIPAGAFVKEYREQSRMDGLPCVAPEDLPREDTFVLGCQAARALFGGNAGLLARFLTAAARCGLPTAGRGFLGVCALSGGDEEAVSLSAYRLMETALRAYAQEQVRTVGYRSLWNKAEDNVRYPVFFTTPDLIGSEASVPMNYVLFDLRTGAVRLPRGAALECDAHGEALARALLGGDAEGVRSLQREAEERVARRKAEEEARRRAEQERIRREAEEKARAEEEARRKAEDARIRQAAEARRRYEEEQRRKAEEEAERARQAAEKRRLYEEEQQRRQEEYRRRLLEEEQKRKAEEEQRLRQAAEKRRLYEEEQRKKQQEAERARAEEELYHKRIRDEYRRRMAEEEARKKAEEESRRSAELQQAAVSSMNARRSRQESALRSAQPYAALNRLLTDLRLTESVSPAELEGKVRDYLTALARGSGGTDEAYLECAERLLKEIAAALSDGRLKQYGLIARCAYVIAECAIRLMFINPAHRYTRGCMQAVEQVNRFMKEQGPAGGAYVSRQRRNKWFVYLNVLDGADDKKSMELCARVIRSIRDNNVNNTLEHMRKKLSELACDMMEAYPQKPARSGEQGRLLRCAELAVLYAEMRFDRADRPVWNDETLLGRKLTRALGQTGMTELFANDIKRLIYEVRR